MDKIFQKGFASIIIIIIVVIIISAIGAAGFWFRGGLFQAPSQESQQEPSLPETQKLPTPTDSAISPSVDKSDPEWIKRYCFAEVKKLPAPPFPVTKVEGPSPIEQGGDLESIFPKGKNIFSCRMKYVYTRNQAYAFYFGEKPFWDINDTNQFRSNVESYYADELAKQGWRNITYEYEELIATPGTLQNLYFRRENPDLGTVEYIDFSLVGIVFLDLTVIEK